MSSLKRKKVSLYKGINITNKEVDSLKHDRMSTNSELAVLRKMNVPMLILDTRKRKGLYWKFPNNFPYWL